MFAATTYREVFQASANLAFAFPILAMEALIILVAVWSGGRPFPALLRLSTPTRIAALTWLVALTAVAFLTAPYPAIAQILLLIALVHASTALALNDLLAGAWRNHGAALLTAAGWGALFYCVVAYGLLLAFRGSATFDWWHPGVGVSHVRQFAFYGLTAAAVGAGLCALRPASLTAFHLACNLAFLAVGSGMCIWSGGRAAVGALLPSFAVAIALCPSPDRKRLAGLLLVGLLAGAALSSIWIPHETYGLPRLLSWVQPAERGANAYTNGRLVMWQETLAAFIDRPVLGHGMGQFKFLVPSARSTFTHPHNSLLQLLFQWGIVGTAAMLVIVRPSGRAALAAMRSRTRSAAATIALPVLSAHLAMSMLEGNLFHVYPTSVVVLALVVLADSDRLPARSRASASR